MREKSGRRKGGKGSRMSEKDEEGGGSWVRELHARKERSRCVQMETTRANITKVTKE